MVTYPVGMVNTHDRTRSDVQLMVLKSNALVFAPAVAPYHALIVASLYPLEVSTPVAVKVTSLPTPICPLLAVTVPLVGVVTDQAYWKK